MDFDEALRKELSDPEFTKYYGEGQAKMELALAMYAARSKLKLTQGQLAKRLDISQPYIAKLEKGDVNPTIGHIGGLLALVGYRMRIITEELISDNAKPTQPLVSKTTTDIDTTAGYLIRDNNKQIMPNIYSLNAVA